MVVRVGLRMRDRPVCESSDGPPSSEGSSANFATLDPSCISKTSPADNGG
jgi:hypothetical protein